MTTLKISDHTESDAERTTELLDSSQTFSGEQIRSNEKQEIGSVGNQNSNGQVHRFTFASRDEYNTLLETGGRAYSD